MEEILKIFDLTPLDGMMIPVVCVLFVVLLKALEAKVFGPYLRLLEAREAATRGSRTAALESVRLADTLAKQYDERIQQTRISSMQQKLAVVDSAKAESEKILRAAEAEAKAVVTRAKERVAARIEGLRADAFKEADELAKLIVERVVSSSGKGATN